MEYKEKLLTLDQVGEGNFDLERFRGGTYLIEYAPGGNRIISNALRVLSASKEGYLVRDLTEKEMKGLRKRKESTNIRKASFDYVLKNFENRHPKHYVLEDVEENN